MIPRRWVQSYFKDKKFVDRVVVTGRAGHGGLGCSSVVATRSRSKRLVPDGGDGGQGGDIVLQASRDIKSLAGFPQLLVSGNGMNGMSKRQHGRKGYDGRYLVPLGTQVWKCVERDHTSPRHSIEKDDIITSHACDSHAENENKMHRQTIMFDLSEDVTADQDEDSIGNSDESAEEKPGTTAYTFVADLIHHGEEVVAVKGGYGGKGNANQVSKRHRAQFTRVAPSTYGEMAKLVIEMKLISDISLVGLPNVGKSSLLRCISAAMPRVDTFAFTTTTPQLGAVVSGYRKFVVSDVPGLIQGAHKNRGVGHTFLKHVERTKVLAFVLDCSGSFSLATRSEDHNSGQQSKHRDHILTAEEQFLMLRTELGNYSSTLLERPYMIVLNKIDLVPRPRYRQKKMEEWIHKETGMKVAVVGVSATGGQKRMPLHIDNLIETMGDMLDVDQHSFLA